MSELCSAVRAVGHEAEEDQVMLTSDGKQMDPSDMIGAYSVGMVIAFNGQIVSPDSSHCVHTVITGEQADLCLLS